LARNTLLLGISVVAGTAALAGVGGGLLMMLRMWKQSDVGPAATAPAPLRSKASSPFDPNAKPLFPPTPEPAAPEPAADEPVAAAPSADPRVPPAAGGAAAPSPVATRANRPQLRKPPAPPPAAAAAKRPRSAAPVPAAGRRPAR
jgi:hypothetical protein